MFLLGVNNLISLTFCECAINIPYGIEPQIPSVLLQIKVQLLRPDVGGLNKADKT